MMPPVISHAHTDQSTSVGLKFPEGNLAIAQQPIIIEQMDDAAEFSASNRSRNHLPVFANCSWNMVYCCVKFEFPPAEFSTFLLVAQQPRKLWTNGDHRQIQSIK